MVPLVVGCSIAFSAARYHDLQMSDWQVTIAAFTIYMCASAVCRLILFGLFSNKMQLLVVRTSHIP